MKRQGREAEVRQFWKDREQCEKIIQEVRDQVEGRGVSADQLVDALMEHEEFWAKLREVFLECQPKQKSGRTRRT